MRSCVMKAIVVGALAAAVSACDREPIQQTQTAPDAAPSPTQAALAEVSAVPRDPYQRSLEIFEFKKAAQSGPERGREIFYYKCWFCHNEFAEGGAPDLRTVYQRPKLVTGAAVSDEAIKSQIREGSTNMASYKYTLTDEDLNDLVSYIKSGCCWDNASTPANPRYRYPEAGE